MTNTSSLLGLGVGSAITTLAFLSATNATFWEAALLLGGIIFIARGVMDNK